MTALLVGIWCGLVAHLVVRLLRFLARYSPPPGPCGTCMCVHPERPPKLPRATARERGRR
jgi:hypothetical protein